jgi:hypothetical protein
MSRREYIKNYILNGNVNEVLDKENILPIYYAALKCDIELFELCIENKANLYLCSNGLMPENSLLQNSLYYFIVFNIIDIINMDVKDIQKNLSIENKNEFWLKIIHDNIGEKNNLTDIFRVIIRMLDILNNNNIDINQIIYIKDDKIFYVTNVLFWLAKHNCTIFVEIFLKVGGDPHHITTYMITNYENDFTSFDEVILDTYQTSPLIEAIKHENVDIIKLLVDKYNVDVSIDYLNNTNALSHSVYCSSLEIFEYLIDKGATFSIDNIKTIINSSLLENSFHYRREEIIYILYKKNILNHDDLLKWANISDNGFNLKQYFFEKNLMYLLSVNILLFI